MRSCQILLFCKVSAHKISQEFLLIPIMLIGLLLMPASEAPCFSFPPSLDRNDHITSRVLSKFIYDRAYHSVPKKHRKESRKIAKAIITAGKRFHIDPIILMSVIYHESRFDPEARGQHGEIGLMQVRPSTAFWMLEKGYADALPEQLASMKKALYDPETNIMLGSAYLAYMKREFSDYGTPLYLAAYNMGPSNARSMLRRGHRSNSYADRILTSHASYKQDLEEQRQLANLSETTASTFGLR